MTMRECPECKVLFKPERESRTGGCCSRRCARLRQARQGVPSFEDKREQAMSKIAAIIDETFKDAE